MQFDAIIVGQGLAGSLLALEMLQQGRSLRVFDNAAPDAASRIALGTINPVTGKNFVLTWMADALFPFAHQRYPELEKLLSAQFFYPCLMLRAFPDEKLKRKWLRKAESREIADWIMNKAFEAAKFPGMRLELGGIYIRNCAWVDIAALLLATERFLDYTGILIRETIDYEAVQIAQDGVKIKDLNARYMICCDGTRALQNPYFGHLRFSFNKGEVLRIRCPDLELDHIVKKDIFLAPRGDGIYDVGTTYNWDISDTSPSQQAREHLEARLRELLKVPFETISHRAGIRPASRDRKPFVGCHPDYPAIALLNGLGAKGLSQAPYFARQLDRYLFSGSELPPEVALDRPFPD